MSLRPTERLVSQARLQTCENSGRLKAVLSTTVHNYVHTAGQKRNSDELEVQEALLNPSRLMRNVFVTARSALAVSGVTDPHIVHFVLNLRNGEFVYAQMMLMAYFSTKQSDPALSDDNIHKRHALMWKGNTAGKRVAPNPRQPGKVSAAEELVKQIVALSRLHELYTKEDESSSAQFFRIVHENLASFLSGAETYLSTASNLQTRMNKISWFLKYKDMPLAAHDWM